MDTTEIYVFKVVCDEWPEHPCYIAAGERWERQFADTVTAMIGEPECWPDWKIQPKITIQLETMSKAKYDDLQEWEPS